MWRISRGAEGFAIRVPAGAVDPKYTISITSDREARSDGLKTRSGQPPPSKAYFVQYVGLAAAAPDASSDPYDPRLPTLPTSSS
jgi:hypothetical protein